MLSKIFTPISISIKWSLLSAILFLLFALACVSTLSILQSRSLRASIETMGRDRLPQVRQLGEIELAMTRFRLAAIRFAMSTTDDRKAEGGELLEQSQRDLSAQFFARQRQIAGDPGAQLLFQDFLAKWSAYLAIQSQFTGAPVTDRESLDWLVNVDSFAAFNAVVSAIENNIKFASLRAGEAVTASEDRSRSFWAAQFSVNLVAGIIGLLTLAFVTREVSLPIRRMTGAMEAIAKGGFDTEIPFADRHNELGLMARALAVFRISLIEHERLSAATRTLSELSEWLQSAKDEPELYAMISRVLSDLMPECRGTLFTFAKSRQRLEVAARWNGASPPETIEPDDCWSLRRGHTYLFGSNEVEFRCAHCAAEKSAQFCCIPILAHGETVGLMHLEYAYRGLETTQEAKARFADRARLGRACVEHISVAIANAKLRESLRDQSARDDLTGLPNRRGLEEAFGSAARKGDGVSVLVIDIDQFKRCNDLYGHAAGDAVLRSVADRLVKSLQGDEFACRFGGEEFVALLPNANLADAARRAEEIRAAIEAQPVRHGGATLPSVTVSIGVMAATPPGADFATCLKAADEALYLAKANGRNRVEMAAGPADLRSLLAKVATLQAGADRAA